MRRRVLVVVQRYGEEVVGGSEQHARLAARRLAERHDVEVATTTALDYWTWAPHFAVGTTAVDGIPVHRFAVASGRAPDFKAFERRVLFEPHDAADEDAWTTKQGPHAPELLEFLHREGGGYDALLFWTYLYEPAARGVPLAPERSGLVSTAHDELPLRLAPYRSLFHLPRAIGYLTPEERALVHREFRNEEVPDVILGTGLEPPRPHDAVEFRRARGLAGPLVLYLGQVSEGKACDELFAAWAAFRDRPGAPAATLVLCGTVRMEILVRDDVLALGRVSDEEKLGALAAADALVLPSRLESLGIVLLEAWQVGTPVLVAAVNPVTAGQVRRAGGGLAYGTPDEFAARLTALLTDRATARQLGARGRAWVERECTLGAFDRRLDELVDLVALQ